jgi:hypothetical protein
LRPRAAGGGGLVPGLVPYARRFIPFGFAGQLFTYTFTGTEPLGDHAWLAGMAQPGTASTIGSLDQHRFAVSP